MVRKSGLASLVFLVVFLPAAAGCIPRSSAPRASGIPAETPAPSRVVLHEQLVDVARREALRLLKDRLHVVGHIGAISELEQEANTLTFIVTFSDVTDTAAEVSVDPRSGAIISSSIGGGL